MSIAEAGKCSFVLVEKAEQLSHWRKTSTMVGTGTMLV